MLTSILRKQSMVSLLHSKTENGIAYKYRVLPPGNLSNGTNLETNGETKEIRTRGVLKGHQLVEDGACKHSIKG